MSKKNKKQQNNTKQQKPSNDTPPIYPNSGTTDRSQSHFSTNADPLQPSTPKKPTTSKQSQIYTCPKCDFRSRESKMKCPKHKISLKLDKKYN